MAQTPETGHAASGRWTKFDVVWMLNLFGTAVGAGILFLPINAGMSGSSPSTPSCSSMPWASPTR